MKTVERARGLYKNGRLWWMRVRKVPRSTGTADLVVANRIAGMVQELSEGNGAAQEWLDRVLSNDVTLLELYQARSAGTLGALAERLKGDAAAEADADLRPWVTKWDSDHLAALVASNKITAGVRDMYLKQVRALISEDRRFPKSKFTEETLKKVLHSLVDGRSGAPLTGSTRRRYFVAWKLFYRWAKKRVPLTVNPFEDAEEWMPENNSPRSMHWDHETTLEVLGKMPEGEAKVMMTLVLGSGMELGAALTMEARHVGKEPKELDELPTVTAPGSKNEFREDRTIFVNRWAFGAVRALADTRKPREPLWSTIDADGTCVREAFYQAQVDAGLIPEPPRSESTGKRLWGQVDPHTIHDSRHTYCFVRMLGDDGEPRQDIKFCATQLGHADEQMVMRIYNKTNMSQRLRLLELREARKEKRA